MSFSASALRVARAGRLLIDGLDIALSPGAGLALRGPNGVGKSTLLRALCGLLPCEGQVELEGAALGTDAYLDRIAYAGHRDAIKAALSVGENLAFWAAMTGGDARAALERFDLEALAERPAGLCSAGQKRRLGLARLALAPRALWLLDEPTVSLDAEHTARFAALLREHLAGGGMAIIATHIDLGLELGELRLEAPQRRVETDPFLDEAWT
ncbi:heme ABC exporter ATP-binding protein CcmA [Pontivivens ytuae]|uniref:Heme ABC exporter ATP-binding protein CcmA n=1 Tax=Pontivivens ytuae TaxID=2789856 RepID=A0A7S9QDZ9_9RHOB|nr:heme ABC exporter ATP-binding protein CcmA [Pontivivens ytuae]QPH54696.1 heme ABC exporter ATP-binding protein CcmA [Pontivivens ytuae]